MRSWRATGARPGRRRTSRSRGRPSGTASSRAVVVEDDRALAGVEVLVGGADPRARRRRDPRPAVTGSARRPAARRARRRRPSRRTAGRSTPPADRTGQLQHPQITHASIDPCPSSPVRHGTRWHDSDVRSDTVSPLYGAGMDLGVCVASSIDDIEYAVLAEELGYSHLWFADSQMLWSDCYATMALAASRTVADQDRHGRRRRRHPLAAPSPPPPTPRSTGWRRAGCSAASAPATRRTG